jgi:hypothetical protein
MSLESRDREQVTRTPRATRDRSSRRTQPVGSISRFRSDCQLWSDPVPVNNEDIVDVLAEIRDPSAIGCLERALWWEPPWDEFRQLAVKVVWALAAIGTPDALAVLRDAVNCEAPQVRAAAAHKLGLAGA